MGSFKKKFQQPLSQKSSDLQIEIYKNLGPHWSNSATIGKNIFT
jgi:hypothetical protein